MGILHQLHERLNQWPLTKQLIKFTIIGSSSTFINFAFLISLTEVFGVWYIISSAVGFVLSAIFNFTFNKSWTFRNPEKGKAALYQLNKFMIVVSLGLVFNTGIIYLFTEWVSWDYRISWFLATIIVTLWNFSLNKFWTFRVPTS